MHNVFLKYSILFIFAFFIGELNAQQADALTPNKTLTVVGNYNSVPYSFFDKNGAPSGFDVDLINAIFKELNLISSVKLYASEEAVNDVENGRADILLGAVLSEDIEKKFDFSEPYLYIDNVIVVRKDENIIKNASGLKNKKVIVTDNSKVKEFLTSNNVTSNIVSVQQTQQALTLLASGKYDCAIVLKPQAKYIINNQVLLNIECLDIPCCQNKYCFAVKKGNVELLSKLNEGIELIRLNKEYDRINTKWLKNTVPEIQKENQFVHILILFIIILLLALVFAAFLLLRLKRKIKNKTEEFTKELVDRKRIENILIEREELLNQASKIAQLGNWIWDGNANVMICSSEIFDILGITDQKDNTLLLDDFYFVIHSDDRENIRQAVQKSFTQKSNFEAEYRVLTAEGIIKYVRAKAVFSYEDEKTVKMTGVMQDVTNYKTALLKIEYSNRLYSFLSQLNEAIVHFPNMNKLFNEICKIGVDYGKFGLVWIGLVEDQTGWVKVESSAGEDDGFLSLNKISVHDNAHGQDTFGQAYRSDRCFFFNDLTRDFNYLPTKREALKRGFRSSASFLIKKNGKKIGAITFYSKELNFFNDTEVKLLEEIADNISFAIDNVEQENIRKITRRALQESQEKYLSVFNSVSDPIFLLDQATGSILDANAAACRLYGYTYDDLLYKTMMDVSVEPDETVGSLRERIDIITNHYHKRQDGSIFPVEVMSTYFVQNNREFAVTVMRDLTESMKSHEKLLESEKRYSSLFQNNRAVMILFDAETGNFVDVNPAACAFYGYSKAQFLNMSIADINLLTTAECFEAIESITKNESSHLYFKHRLSNGDIRDVEAFTGLMNLLGKEVYYSIIYDITERRKAELELIAAKEKAEEANRLKTSLLGNMSHELRTPLTGILGFSQILIDEISDEFLKDMVDKILRSGKRLMTTLNSILNISELESNRLDIKLTELNLAYSVKEKLYEFEKNAIEKNLTFEFKSLDPNIFIYADENFINQIVENIVDNAVKYTEIGGINVIVDSEKDDGRFWGVLKVIDTGIGIPAHLHELIFEEFRQASEGFNRSFEGSGLGLTLAKKMINLLGGTIEVESGLGKGSTFTVKIPGYLEFSDNEIDFAYPKENKQTAAGQQVSENALLPEIAAQNKDLPLVMLVEDNYINSDVTIMFLKGICDVDHSIDGENAINMAGINKYDAILMDINLGGKMNGIEVLKEIRKIPGYNNVPVIALTGYAMSGDRQKLMNEGFNNYMSKPFEKEDIVNLVKLVIKK